MLSAISLVLGAFAVATFLLRPGDASKQLEVSLRILLDEKLNTPYSVESKKLDAHERDAGGRWMIVIHPQSDIASRLIDLGFAPAIASDEEDLRRVTNESRLTTEPVNAYSFFSHDMALGPGSICESLPCNIDIGVAPTGGKLVISISKI